MGLFKRKKNTPPVKEIKWRPVEYITLDRNDVTDSVIQLARYVEERRKQIHIERRSDVPRLEWSDGEIEFLVQSIRDGSFDINEFLRSELKQSEIDELDKYLSSYKYDGCVGHDLARRVAVDGDIDAIMDCKWLPDILYRGRHNSDRSQDRYVETIMLRARSESTIEQFVQLHDMAKVAMPTAPYGFSPIDHRQKFLQRLIDEASINQLCEVRGIGHFVQSTIDEKAGADYQSWTALQNTAKAIFSRLYNECSVEQIVKIDGLYDLRQAFPEQVNELVERVIHEGDVAAFANLPYLGLHLSHLAHTKAGSENVREFDRDRYVSFESVERAGQRLLTELSTDEILKIQMLDWCLKSLMDIGQDEVARDIVGRMQSELTQEQWQELNDPRGRYDLNAIVHAFHYVDRPVPQATYKEFYGFITNMFPDAARSLKQPNLDRGLSL
jgi:hypothetical protein